MDIERLKKYFKDDKYVELSGIEILEVTDSAAVIGAAILPCHLNANGVVQGGMLYTMADFAFAVLANNLHPVTVSQTGQITYLSAAVTDYITAEATEIARKGRNCVCNVVMKDNAGNIVCTAQFNGFIKTTDNEAKL